MSPATFFIEEGRAQSRKGSSQRCTANGIRARTGPRFPNVLPTHGVEIAWHRRPPRRLATRPSPSLSLPSSSWSPDTLCKAQSQLFLLPPSKNVQNGPSLVPRRATDVKGALTCASHAHGLLSHLPSEEGPCYAHWTGGETKAGQRDANPGYLTGLSHAHACFSLFSHHTRCPLLLTPQSPAPLPGALFMLLASCTPPPSSPQPLRPSCLDTGLGEVSGTRQALSSLFSHLSSSVALQTCTLTPVGLGRPFLGSHPLPQPSQCTWLFCGHSSSACPTLSSPLTYFLKPAGTL